MSTVLKNARIFVDGWDVSGDLNRMTLQLSAASLDATTFADGSRIKKGGLKTARAQGRGFFQSGANAVDPSLYDLVGREDVVFTAFPTTIIEGSTSTGSGYAFKVVGGRFSPGGKVGDLLAFDFEIEGRGVQS